MLHSLGAEQAIEDAEVPRWSKVLPVLLESIIPNLKDHERAHDAAKLLKTTTSDVRFESISTEVCKSRDGINELFFMPILFIADDPCNGFYTSSCL